MDLTTDFTIYAKNLSFKIHKQYCNYTSLIEPEDLFQVGVETILKMPKEKRYNERQFRSYFYLRVRGSMLDEIQRVLKTETGWKHVPFEEKYIFQS